MLAFLGIQHFRLEISLPPRHLSIFQNQHGHHPRRPQRCYFSCTTICHLLTVQDLMCTGLNYCAVSSELVTSHHFRLVGPNFPIGKSLACHRVHDFLDVSH